MGEEFIQYGHLANGSVYASANFDTPSYESNLLEGLASGDVEDIVSQSLTRHIQTASPREPSAHNWRRSLRDLMLAQTESVLNFLVRPPAEQGVIGPVESMLRKYTIRKEVDFSSMKNLQEVLAVSPGCDSEKEIKECLEKGGASTLAELRIQVTSLIDMYKETGEKIMECEGQLKMRMEKLGKLHKQVSSVLELPENPDTQELLASMHTYLQKSATNLNIEDVYKQLLYSYNKHIALRDAIQIFKLGSCLPSEPVCPICLTDTITYAIVSCGHTFCTACCRKMTYECMMCRGKIKERMKIYMS